MKMRHLLAELYQTKQKLFKTLQLLEKARTLIHQKELDEMKDMPYRYCLSENDLDIIRHYNVDKKGKERPLSENARKTLIMLSEAFGGLHHLDSDQLKIFDYQSDFYNQYLLNHSIATFDDMRLTCLVIMAHDMAVRFDIQPTNLDPTDEYFDRKILQEQCNDVNGEYDTEYTPENLYDDIPKPRSAYLRLMFHERTRDGDFSRRHPTLEESMVGFRTNNRRYH